VVVTGNGRCEPGVAYKTWATWRSLYAGAPNLPAVVLRELARFAGVHVFPRRTTSSTPTTVSWPCTRSREERSTSGCRSPAGVRSLTAGARSPRLRFPNSPMRSSPETRLYYLGPPATWALNPVITKRAVHGQGQGDAKRPVHTDPPRWGGLSGADYGQVRWSWGHGRRVPASLPGQDLPQRRVRLRVRRQGTTCSSTRRDDRLRNWRPATPAAGHLQGGELNRSEGGRLLEAGVVGSSFAHRDPRAARGAGQLHEVPPVGTRAGAPCYCNVDYEWPGRRPRLAAQGRPVHGDRGAHRDPPGVRET